jgi:3-oxoacyl-[acyl-carrier-protein] synthase I
MPGPRAQIVGLGAATPLGRDVWASAAAARAGVCACSEHPFLVDTAGEPMKIARAAWLDVSLELPARCRALLFAATDEALAAIGGREAWADAKTGLALALPPHRPGRPVDLARLLSESIAARYPGQFSTVAVYESGHAAGHLALDAAVRSVTTSSTDAYLVAGVDSYLTAETLEWIEACEQLHGAGALNNAWGFIPGEAAGALLIASERFAERLHLERLGEIAGIGLGRETRLIKTDAVCIGEGLTQAFRAALATLPHHERIDNVFCDLNGEPYRADEYGFTALRVKERFLAVNDFVAPADCWGDVGAAGALLHVALGAIAHRKRYANGPLSLVCASSETGERGAAVLRGFDADGR